MIRSTIPFLITVFSPLISAYAQETSVPSDPAPIIAKVIDAGGGAEKLLKLFRIKERYNFGPTLVEVEKAVTRESVLEPPAYWWVGGSDRTDEPAKFDVWAWTLGALLDPKSLIESIAGITENERPALGLRVSGTIDPAMDLYFDSDTHRLTRFDWRGDIYRFSDWKEHDGAAYPAKCILYKIKSGEPWLYHEIIELERLADLPAGLHR